MVEGQHAFHIKLEKSGINQMFLYFCVTFIGKLSNNLWLMGIIHIMCSSKLFSPLRSRQSPRLQLFGRLVRQEPQQDRDRLVDGNQPEVGGPQWEDQSGQCQGILS